MTFLRHLRGEAGRGVTACHLVNQDLDEGAGIEEIFGIDAPLRAPGWEDSGYSLKVRKRNGGYRIAFGCRAGPDAGDGAEWKVTFGDDGAMRCEGPLDPWIG